MLESISVNIDSVPQGTSATRRTRSATSTISGRHTRQTRLYLRPLCAALIAASVLSACGGGSDSASTVTTNPSSGSQTPGSTTPADTSKPGTTTPAEPSTPTTPTTPTTPPPTDGGTSGATPAPVPSGTQMTMICADGAGYQCSGSSIIRVDNGIALTSSGVEAYGVSTSDLAAKNPTMTGAFGLALATGGTAEVRLAKGSDGTVSSSAVLLSKLGLSWDGKTERPPIIDTFSTTQGRTVLTASGALSSTTLPASSDLGFYDYASKGTAGTQVDYANNRYFPRSTPSRCPPDLVPCPTTETSGVHYSPGDWRTGGKMPDLASVSRVHEDGDIHAGNGLPDANGNPTILPGGDGIGVPFPGSKGYRSLDNWGLQYGNLAAWLTQDTVIIEEWAKAGNEHNKNRRGMVAYGDVTNPTAVPTSGTASYSGFAYGWYTPNGTAEPAVFRGTVVVSVNFATRQTTVTIQNPVTWDSAGTSVPVALTTTVPMGAAGSNVANYLTGPVTNGALTGGVGGRYFGPVLTTGTSGAGPAEIGGTITLSNATSGQTVLGGFIARKQ